MTTNINRPYRSALFLSAIATVFLLQSCCWFVPQGATKRKPCNCKDDKPAYAAAVNKEDEPVKTAEKNSFIGEVSVSDLLIPKAPDKKPPLGIKGISTRFIAAPNLSFKSSKEDYGSTDHKHKPGVGFQFGVGTVYTFSDKFAVNTSLLLKHNTAKEVLNYSTPTEPGVEPISGEIESKYSYSYLSAPILAEMKVSDQLTVIAGPEINYLLSANVKTNAYGESEKTDIKDNSVSLGAGLQLGLRYDLPNSPVGIQLLYDHRLSRLNEKTTEYSPGMGYEMPAWNMKSIQLGVTCDLCELFRK
jgi:hypothetical protein